MQSNDASKKIIVYLLIKFFSFTESNYIIGVTGNPQSKCVTDFEYAGDDKKPIKVRLPSNYKEKSKNKSINYGIKFTLFRKDEERGEQLYLDKLQALESSHFNPYAPTFIITHGWLSDQNGPSCQKIKTGK